MIYEVAADILAKFCTIAITIFKFFSLILKETQSKFF